MNAFQFLACINMREKQFQNIDESVIMLMESR